MADLSVTVDTRKVNQALAEAARAAHDLGPAARPAFRSLVDRLVQTAVNKAPVATGALRGGAIGEVTMAGGAAESGHVSFGGRAEKYASVQHERVDFRHTLPAGMNRQRTKAGRARKHPLLGYRGGQAKFLFGRGDSAWNPGEAQEWARLLSERVALDLNRKLEQG